MGGSLAEAIKADVQKMTLDECKRAWVAVRRVAHAEWEQDNCPTAFLPEPKDFPRRRDLASRSRRSSGYSQQIEMNDSSGKTYELFYDGSGI